VRFYPEYNVRVLAAAPSLDDPDATAREGGRGGWLRLAIEGVPDRVLAHGSGALPTLGPRNPARRSPREVILDAAPAGLTALLEAWKALGSEGERVAAAVAAAASGYAVGLNRSAPPRVVGILNVTPDSFSDGGQYPDPGAAVAAGLRLVEEGADWLDVGGESTRPGAAEVPAEEELRRVVPVIRGLAAAARVPISIDTRKAAVAAAALAAGASIVNDVSGLCHDARLGTVAAEAGAGLILMHMPGNPATMQQHTGYDDVVADSMRFLRERAEVAVAAGIAPDRLWIDPGFGFGKTVPQNLAILRRLREYTAIGLPVLVGTSRKSTIGAVLGGLPPAERQEGTAATVAAAVLNGAAAVRVHDVRAMARVVTMAWAIASGAN
jgi:dihydropteroate synthase